MNETTQFFVLRTVSQDEAFDGMHRLIDALEASRVGLLRHVASDATDHSERFSWELSNKAGELAVVIHDDETVPAMVLEVSGTPALLKTVLPFVPQCFEVSTNQEAIEQAKRDYAEDPSLLVLAAWVAEADDPSLFAVLQEASHHPEVAVRQSVAKAAAVQATPRTRALAQQMADDEPDADLAARMQQVLGMWSA